MHPGEVDDTLHEIVDSGNLAGTLEYINQHGLTPDWFRFSRPFFTSPVTLAAFCGQGKILETLLSKGYDPSEDCFMEGDFFNSGGSDYVANPIHMACNNGELHIVKSLIEDHGVDVNVPDSKGYTPLWYALHGRLEDRHCFSYVGVEYLIEAGASLDTCVEDCTYLHVASRIESDPSICEYIIEQGEEVNACTSDGYTPLHIAAEHSKANVLSLLEAGADANAETHDKQTPFLCAVNSYYVDRNDKINILNILCEHGANPETSDKRGNTALSYAVRRHVYDVVRLLVVDLNVSLETKSSKERIIERITMKLQHQKRDEDKAFFDCIELIVRAGFSLGQMFSEYDFKYLLDRAPDLQNCIVYLKQTSSNPRTLQELSCFEIRRHLGRRIRQNIGYLPLPQRLKDVVLLKNLLGT